MCKYFLAILLLANITVNSSSVDEQEAQYYVDYVNSFVLSATIAPLPDGKDLDGNPLATGNLFIVSPRRSVELKSYFSDTIKDLTKRVVVAQKDFFSEKDSDKKLKLRDALVRLVVSRAILGHASSWNSLCLMVISPEIYLAKNQESRRRIFHAQAESYRLAKQSSEVGLLTDVNWFYSSFRSLFHPERGYNELRKHE